jgi:hypothetical protein
MTNTGTDTQELRKLEKLFSQDRLSAAGIRIGYFHKEVPVLHNLKNWYSIVNEPNKLLTAHVKNSSRCRVM